MKFEKEISLTNNELMEFDFLKIIFRRIILPAILISFYASFLIVMVYVVDVLGYMTSFMWSLIKISSFFMIVYAGLTVLAFMHEMFDEMGADNLSYLPAIEKTLPDVYRWFKGQIKCLWKYMCS